MRDDPLRPRALRRDTRSAFDPREQRRDVSRFQVFAAHQRAWEAANGPNVTMFSFIRDPGTRAVSWAFFRKARPPPPAALPSPPRPALTPPSPSGVD